MCVCVKSCWETEGSTTFEYVPTARTFETSKRKPPKTLSKDVNVQIFLNVQILFGLDYTIP